MMMYEDQESLFLDEMEDAGKQDVKKADKADKVGGGSRKRGRPRKASAGGGSSMKGVGRDRALYEAKHRPEDIIHPPTIIGGGNVPALQAGPMAGEGKNTLYTNFALEVGQLPWPDYNSPDSLIDNVRGYFEAAAKYDCKPGAAGLALALKLDRRRLWEVVNDQPGGPKIPEESKNIIRLAYQHLNVMWEQYMQNGQINPASGIFIGINNFGYHNEQNIVLKPAVSENTIDVDAIASKYNEIPE